MEMEKEEEAMEIRMEEWSGSSMNNLMKTALITANSSSLSYQREAGRFRETRWRFMRAFIPEGFPGSVTPDYATFQIWDSLQGLSTYIRSMLSTQALLSAIGVGEGTATVIGATFQWFLRDFSGMLGSIGFTFFQGSNLDANAKMWRLTADFMNDLGMLMDLTSPLFPSAFIAILCFGSISRSFTGVASGATRAALTQHFALEKNAADISAKEGSQETMATMTGMMLGMLLAHFIAGNSMAIWFSFLLLTAFHLYANYKAVRCLILTTLNTERCSILLQYFMRTGQALSPKQVSEMEHVLPTWIYVWSSEKQLLHKKIQLGMRISRLRHSELMELAAAANSHHFKDRYLLIERRETIFVILHKLCTAADILQSYIHALVLANFLPINKALHLKSHAWMDEHYAGFITQLQASGWNTERLLAPTAIYKAQWEFSSMLDKTK